MEEGQGREKRYYYIIISKIKEIILSPVKQTNKQKKQVFPLMAINLQLGEAESGGLPLSSIPDRSTVWGPDSQETRINK